jgi:hypothetical protein
LRKFFHRGKNHIEEPVVEQGHEIQQ